MTTKFEQTLEEIMLTPPAVEPSDETRLEAPVVFLDQDATSEEVEEYIQKENAL